MDTNLVDLFERRGHLEGVQRTITQDEVGALVTAVCRGSEEDEMHLRDLLMKQGVDYAADMMLIATRFCHQHYIAWLKALPPDQRGEHDEELPQKQ